MFDQYENKKSVCFRIAAESGLHFSLIELPSKHVGRT